MSAIFASNSSQLYRAAFIFLVVFQFFCKKTFAIAYSYPLLGHVINDSALHKSKDVYEYLVHKNTLLHSQDEVNNTGLGKIRKSKDQSISFFLLVFVLGILAIGRWIFAPHMQKVNDIFSSPFNTSKSKTEENGFIISMFTLLYAITITYLIYLIIIFILPTYSHLHSFLIALGVVSAYLIFKNLFSYIIAWTYNRNLIWSEAYWQNYQINKLITMVLIPLCLLITIKEGSSGSLLLKIACLCLGLGILFKVIKNTPLVVKLLKDFKLNFILYLCALEIFPLAICIHWLLK